MYVLQLCHDYKAPFLNVSRQYASLFEGTKYKVITVYIKGSPCDDVVSESNCEEVIFLDYKSRDIKGLKRKQIKDIKELHAKYNFAFAIAQRYKALYIASHVPGLFCIGVHHIRGGYSRWTRKLYVSRKKSQIAILGVSKAVRDNIRQDLPKFPTAQIQHLHNSLDIEDIQSQQISKEAARDFLSLEQDDYIIGNVGRLHADKDQATLIRGFAAASPHMPNAKLVIIGNGDLKDSLNALAKELNVADKVILTGPVPQAFKYFKAFDCFVLSSIKEGLPVALLEAYAAENLCTTSRCDGSTEAIEGAGQSFAIGDDKSLSKILQEYYALSAEQQTEARKLISQKLHKSFSIASMRNSFWNLPFIPSSK